MFVKRECREPAWAVHAVVCYLQAIACKVSKSSRIITRILWLLSYDSEPGGPIIRAFEQHWEYSPAWVWLLFTPQLLTSLARHEGHVTRHVLTRVTRMFPQGVYYPVRAHLLEKREQLQLQRQTAQQKYQHALAVHNQTTPHLAPPQYVEVLPEPGAEWVEDLVRNVLSRQFPALVTELERIVDEFSRRFRPELEEELLNHVHSLLGKCWRLPVGVEHRDTIPPALVALLERACRKFFTIDPKTSTSRRHYLFVQRYRAAFERDFLPPRAKLVAAGVAMEAPHLARAIDAYQVARTRPQAVAGSVNSGVAGASAVLLSNSSSNTGLSSAASTVRAQARRFPVSLSEVISRLRQWKNHLDYKLQTRAHTQLQLERLSPFLARQQQSFDVEIPGQYWFADRETPVMTAAEQHASLFQSGGGGGIGGGVVGGGVGGGGAPGVGGAGTPRVTLARFDPEIVVQQHNGVYRRRVGMVGSNGKTTYFLVSFASAHLARNDERMMQMYLMLNRMMEKSKETRKRNLAFHVPLIVPLQHRMQLHEAHPSMQTLEHIYEQSCAMRGVDPMSPLLAFREMLNKVEQPGEFSPQALAARYRWFEETSATTVPDHILSRHFAASVRHADQLWAVKKEFAAQLALTGYLSYILKIGDRVPHKLGFNRHSGRIVQTEFCPVYHDRNFTIECQEPVPFRLTRGMTHFVSPCMVGGLVSAVLTAVNTCLISNQDTVKSYLSLFLRDDLMSYLSGKYPLLTDHEARGFEAANKDKVAANMLAVLRRIHLLMPAPQNPTPDKRSKYIQQQLQQQPQAVNSKVDDLIALAVSKRQLSQMPPVWFPML